MFLTITDKYDNRTVTLSIEHIAAIKGRGDSRPGLEAVDIYLHGGQMLEAHCSGQELEKLWKYSKRTKYSHIIFSAVITSFVLLTCFGVVLKCLFFTTHCSP